MAASTCERTGSSRSASHSVQSPSRSPVGGAVAVGDEAAVGQLPGSLGLGAARRLGSPEGAPGPRRGPAAAEGRGASPAARTCSRAGAGRSAPRGCARSSPRTPTGCVDRACGRRRGRARSHRRGFSEAKEATALLLLRLGRGGVSAGGSSATGPRFSGSGSGSGSARAPDLGTGSGSGRPRAGASGSCASPIPSKGRLVGVASSSITASSQPSSLVGAEPFSAVTLTFVPQPFSASSTLIQASSGMALQASFDSSSRS